MVEAQQSMKNDQINKSVQALLQKWSWRGMKPRGGRNKKKKSQPEREAPASGGIKVELTNKEV